MRVWVWRDVRSVGARVSFLFSRVVGVNVRSRPPAAVLQPISIDAQSSTPTKFVVEFPQHPERADLLSYAAGCPRFRGLEVWIRKRSPSAQHRMFERESTVQHKARCERSRTRHARVGHACVAHPRIRHACASSDITTAGSALESIRDPASHYMTERGCHMSNSVAVAGCCM